MSAVENANDEFEKGSDLKQSVELICDLSRRLQLLDELLAGAQEKRQLLRADQAEQGSTGARGSFIQ